MFLAWQEKVFHTQLFLFEKSRFFASVISILSIYMKAINLPGLDKKWQSKWAKAKIYQTKDLSDKPKFYVLDMFPYPSGSAMHVGHCKGYIASDVVARMKMMQGYNVLHPMGWDAFGLPAENFAIKNKIHPAKAVAQNISKFKKQLELIGFTYDWAREINTTDPDYYKWTQWQFKKMFEAGLIRSIMDPVNYCPSCKTVLANEDVEDGKCERCSTLVQRKPIREWEILITKYAQRLLQDLDQLDWEESILEMQRNWIGKSEGAEITFKIQPKGEIKIFTTRLDTIFGCTYCVVAPEHPIIQELKENISNDQEIQKYIEASKQKTDLERTDLAKEKTGVEIKGIKAVNPFNNQEVSVFVGDYVLGHYGTGAIMAVPAHDQRDFEFAQKHNLEIKEVIKNSNGETVLPFVLDGALINSQEFSNLTSEQARIKMAELAVKKGFGQKTINYKMRDWVFARQRYWGEPIPLVYCQHCADAIKSGNYQKDQYSQGEINNPGWIAVPDKDLPIKLPNVKSYQPSGDGQSPLASIAKFVNTKCPKCKGKAIRETNTMPQWAGSCWYYLRYIDPKNKKSFVDINKEKYWSPVDLYIGGAEHATRHLLYARFWHKFLKDSQLVNYDEPFKRLQHVGLILGQDGQKMSKRWGNVIDPDDVVKQYGADALRVYEMFMGPFGDSIAWNTQGLVGAKRFLEKVVSIKGKTGAVADSKELVKMLHQTIDKISKDIQDFKFNTAISQLMIFANEAEKQEKITENTVLTFAKLLAPFAPHLAEEIWQEKRKGKFVSIFQEAWPKADPDMLVDDEVDLIVQINGKVREIIKVDANISKDQALELVMQRETIKKWIGEGKPRNIIFVPKKLINIVF